MKTSALRQKAIIRVALIVAALFVLIVSGSFGCNSYKSETKLESIPFYELQQNDPSLQKGLTKVKQEGVNGTKEVTFKVTYKKGKELSREVASVKILREATPKIVMVGSYVAPTPTPTDPDVDNSGQQLDGPTFHGYPCEADCSGHEAGYEWAYDNGITDPEDCTGNSDSFIEGCVIFTEENAEDQQVDEDEELDDNSDF